MYDLLFDLRYSMRAFRHSPLHSLVTVLILGVGVGAVTLMFSALNASVLRPLPYREPDRLVWAWKANDQVSQNSLSYDDYLDYKEGVPAFEDLAAWYVFFPPVLVTGLDEAELVTSSQVTPNFFSTLGVSPALGRAFLPEEAVLGGPDVAVISDAYWQGRFGGDPTVVGRTLTLDGRPTEIVGVMPRGFAFTREVQAWLPVRAGDGPTQGRGNNNFFMVGRLREGFTITQAQEQLAAVTRGIQEANPDFSRWYHWLQPLHEVFFGDIRRVLLILMGIVSLVPLVACANVASLTLARAATRGTELATRLALGANRWRVLRQLTVESLLLALLGGALGILLAYGGGLLVRSLGPATLPRLDEIGLDPVVLTFATVASLLTVPLFGVLPALRGTGFDLASALRFGGGRGGSQGQGRSRPLLVVVQVALSMTLLLVSGLFLRSFLELEAVHPGFDTQSLLTARIQLPSHKFATQEELTLAWDQTFQRLGGVPGVLGVAGADWLPVSPGGGPWNSLSRPDRPGSGDQAGVPATRKFVSPDYFRVLGVSMREGRAFGADDRPGTPDAMVLSESLARILFPEESPLGKPVSLWGRPFEVVGVAADVAEEGLGVRGRPTFFVANRQFPRSTLRLLVRSAGYDPLRVTGALREALRQTDPDIALTNVLSMEARIGQTLSQPRFRTGLVGAFALVGLLLAAFGLYGVLAYLVTRRKHEIGIRIAVGAQSGDIVGLVLRSGMGMVGLGAALGLLMGGGASLLVRSLLFEVSASDPLTLGGSSAALLLTGLGASLLPAMKAMKVDPLEALRAE